MRYGVTEPDYCDQLRLADWLRRVSMRPERVVVLSDSSRLIGGAEAMALLSARAMADAGIPVTFIAGDSAIACPLDRSKIEVIALGGRTILERPALERGITAIYNRRVESRISTIIGERDTPKTVYHLHNWSQIFSPSVFSALSSVSSRLFISAHDFSLVCPNLAYTNYRKQDEACPLTPLGSACLATNCDRRSYMHKLWRVARSMARRLAMDLARSGASVGIIHPDMAEYFTRGGIPLERLRVVRNPVTPYSDTRIETEKNQDIFVIGRIVHEKGIDLAAEAARMTGRRLRVIGDGDMREALSERYPEVVFEGWKTHAEICRLMQHARVLVVPSRLPETFTLVAHEAMRSGIPVVAFADVDCAEAAAIGGAIAVPPRQAAALADGIRRLDDDAVNAEMSVIAFNVGARFSHTPTTWRDALLQEYAALFRQSAGEAGWSRASLGAA